MLILLLRISFEININNRHKLGDLKATESGSRKAKIIFALIIVKQLFQGLAVTECTPFKKYTWTKTVGAKWLDNLT